MTAVTVKGLTKSFGTHAAVLDGVDLHVPEGGLTAILGPSGCGKTTLLRLIAGFTDPDDGTIALGEEVVHAPGCFVPARRRRIGYVAQEGALFPHLTVAANVAFGLSRKDRRDRDRIVGLLDLVGMPAAFARRYPHELSGGQQQRVALARALAPAPTVVLLDEPFSALDAGLRESTRRAVRDALVASGATAILVTHDQAEALSLADQVGVMHQGTITQLGTPSEVYRRPADTATATFVGDAVLLPATVRSGVAECALGAVPTWRSTVEGPAQVLLRPEQLQLSGNGVAARIRDVSYFGHDAMIRLDVLPAGVSVLARVAGHEQATVGAEVRVTVIGEGTAFPAP